MQICTEDEFWCDRNDRFSILGLSYFILSTLLCTCPNVNTYHSNMFHFFQVSPEVDLLSYPHLR